MYIITKILINIQSTRVKNALNYKLYPDVIQIY